MIAKILLMLNFNNKILEEENFLKFQLIGLKEIIMIGKILIKGLVKQTLIKMINQMKADLFLL